MSTIDKNLLLEELKNNDKYKELMIQILEGEFDSKDYKAMAQSFVGKELSDSFCNGFFGRDEYDLQFAKIERIYESEEYENDIVIKVKKKWKDEYSYGHFDGGWANWKTVYELIDEWVNQ